MAKRNVHKLIKFFTWIAILASTLTFIFAIILYVSVADPTGYEGAKRDKYDKLFSTSLIGIISTFIIFEILDVIIGIIAFATEKDFIVKSRRTQIIIYVVVSFFTTTVVGITLMIIILLIVHDDANTEEPNSSELDQQTQDANGVTVASTQEPSPSNTVGPAETTNYTEAASSAEIPLQTMDTTGIHVTATQEPSPYSTVGPAGTTNYTEAASSAEVPLPPDPIYGY